jgi:type II secretory pathway component HofQ
MAILRGRNGFRSIKSTVVSIGFLAALAVAGGTPVRILNVEYNNTPVRLVLAALFRSAGINYTVDAGVSGSITVKLSGVPFETALKVVLNANTPPLVAIKDPESGVYYIKVRVNPSEAAGNSAGQSQSGTPPAKLISLDFNSTPIRDALSLLFKAAGLNYAVDAGVSGYATVNLHEVSFETALKAVLKSNGGILAVHDPDTGVYYIKVKGSQTETTGGAARNE